MSLNPEWKSRIKNWKDKLPDLFYRPLGEILLKGHVTSDLLTLKEAVKRDFKSMPHGTGWGGKWEYGWFCGNVEMPGEAEGKRIVLKADTGAEGAVYINGINAGAYDRFHKEITLASHAKQGDRYDFMIEAYAGHGPRVCEGGPIEHGRESVPEPPETQAVVGNSTFGIWSEEIYQLWIDIETLYQIRENIDGDSLRVAKIDEALKKFTLTVDLELEHEEMLETAIKCRNDLKPLFDCVNGSTVPAMFVFGNSHIDVAWLWPLAETERKCCRTFSTQLELMKEYPEYKFLQSQAHLYLMIKENYPKLYNSLKEAISKGQLIPDGGMWVEPDTNVTGGESLIRQFIHGKRFFMEEFGVESKLCWLPDVFGYTGAFPQIMKGCEIDYFSTQKIFWTYNGGERFPYHTFWWEGIDGTTILSHIYNDYTSHTKPESVIKRWDDRVQKDGISTRMFPFGYGDGGGGPTRDHLEYLKRIENLEGVPKTKMCEPVEFFEDLEKIGAPDEKYVGELYLQVHRGTYTSQAKTKKGNRKSEIALREAELWGTAANVIKKHSFDNMTLDGQWKTILLNQFHDILPGSSIHRVYEEAEADYESVLATTAGITESSLKSLTCEDKNGVSIFNSLSWESKKLVEIPGDYTGAVDAEENILEVQRAGDKLYVEASVPSCGWTTVYPRCNGASSSHNVAAEKGRLENELIRVSIDENGEITSIFDKENNRELAASGCNVFKMYKDVPNVYDAWDIDSMYRQTPVHLDSKAEIDVVSSGPLFASVKVRKTLNNSQMEQEIILRRNSRRVDFKTSINWQESHKLLKVNFPVNVHSNEAVHEIQFGYLKRPNHRSTNYEKDRFEVSNHKWSALVEGNHGFAVLNDCKYGLDVYENSINLTLLKSALAPDMYADKGIQEFTYSIYLWEGSLSESGIVREGYELNCPPLVKLGEAGRRSLFSVDKDNIIIDTVKFAEDGSGDIIIRMYESMHMSSKCSLSTSVNFESAVGTNMMEKPEENLINDEKTINLDFRPFEIKTVKLKL